MREHESTEPALRRNDNSDSQASLARSLLVERHDAGGVRVIALRGELDLASAPKFEQELEIVLNGDDGPIVVDLCDLEFMDSTGLRTLIMAQRRADAREQRFAVARRTGEFVARVFELAGADRAFELFNAREIAIAAVRD